MRYYKNTQQLWQDWHNYPILAQSQSIFYLHKASDGWSLFPATNPLIHLPIDHYKHKRSPGICYMHEVPSVVDYCTKYQQHQCIFFLRSQQTKCKKSIAIITQIWESQMLFYMCPIFTTLMRYHKGLRRYNVAQCLLVASRGHNVHLFTLWF